MIRKTALLVLLLILTFSIIRRETYASNTLLNASDTMSASRPSASAPIYSGQTQPNQIEIADDLGFTSSDWAILKGYTEEKVLIASVSAQTKNIPKTRLVYFTRDTMNNYKKGDLLIVPVTAMHKIQFKTKTAIPAQGQIIITFPVLLASDSNNPASPSAGTFQLNNLSDSNVKIDGLSGAGTFSGTYKNPTSGSSPTVTLNLTGTTSASASSTVTVFLGCKTSTGPNCSILSPTIINPSKSLTATSSATWQIQIQTKDTVKNLNLDSAKVNIKTNNLVQTQAAVEPRLTFSIEGVPNDTPVNSGNTKGCQNSEKTNSGIDSTFTSVNLGNLSEAQINIAAQKITVSTNSKFGYALTAISNNHLIDQKSGFRINDSSTPSPIKTGVTFFGIHPCGPSVPSLWWSSNPFDQTGFGIGAKYGWPEKNAPLVLVSDPSGPIPGDLSGKGVTSIEYASTVSSVVPAGNYSSKITYIVTPTF